MFVRSPTLTNSESSVTFSGSSPDRRRAGAILAGHVRGLAVDRLAEHGDVVRRRAAAAADDVDQAAPGELLHDRRHLLGGLVVLAERVGQPRVRVAGDETVGDAGDLGEVRPDLVRAESAVEADGDRPRVPDRVVERLGDLPRQGATGRVRDGARDDDRPAPRILLEQRLAGEDRRLRVEGVEDRLDEQQVGAAVDEAARLLEVGGDELVVGDVALARVVDVGGDRRRAVGRAEGTGDVARPVGGALGHRVALGAGDPRGGEVHLVGEVDHVVVAQADRVGVEGVRLEQVGAGGEVLAVDPGDDVGRGEDEEVVVAAQVARPVGEPLAAEVPLRRARAAGSSCPSRRRARGSARRGALRSSSVASGRSRSVLVTVAFDDVWSGDLPV